MDIANKINQNKAGLLKEDLQIYELDRAAVLLLLESWMYDKKKRLPNTPSEVLNLLEKDGFKIVRNAK